MKKNYLLKKASDDKKLFNSCLGIIRKENLFILCLKSNIANIDPILPPNKLLNNNLFSDILETFFEIWSAWSLS